MKNKQNNDKNIYKCNYASLNDRDTIASGIVRQFCRCENITEDTYTILDGIAYWAISYRLLFLDYKTVQHITYPTDYCKQL